MITFIVSPSFDTKPKIIMITFIIDIIILSLSLSVCSILKIWIRTVNGSVYFFTSFLRSIVLIRAAFVDVSSWILSIDSDRFSHLPTGFCSMYDEILRTDQVFQVRAIWKLYYQSAIITHVFESYSVLRDTTLVQWLFCPSLKNIYIYIYIYIYILWMHVVLGRSLQIANIESKIR